MHERTLVQGLIRQVERLAREAQADRVTEVRLQVGEFSGVEPELIRLAFDERKVDTFLAGARLELHVVSLEGQCTGCGLEFAIRRFRMVCPDCNSSAVRVLRGEELILQGVTLETDEPAAPDAKREVPLWT